MPFTPIHMGPGILIKSLLRYKFSLLIFGWTQIVIDLQPLWAILSGSGPLHGFSHTFTGAVGVAVIAAWTGLLLLKVLPIARLGVQNTGSIPFTVAMLSAFIGSFSHVLLDNIMHSDLRPFSPFSESQWIYGSVSHENLHLICFVSAIAGVLILWLRRLWPFGRSLT